MKRFLKILAWLLVSLVALLALGRALMAPAVEYGLADWFAGQGIETSVGEVLIDVDAGRFELADLRGSRNGESVFRVDRLALGWEWQGVLDNHLVVRGIEIEGVEFSVDSDPANERLVVAGIDLGGETAAPEPEPVAEATGKPWSIDLERLKLADITVCLRRGTAIDICNRLESLELQASADLRPDPDSGPHIETSGRVDLAGLQAVHSGETVFSLGKLGLAWQLQRQPELKLALQGLDIDGVRFSVDSDPDNGRLVVAGLDLGGESTTAETSPTEATPDAPDTAWDVELDGLGLADIDICLRQGDSVDVCNRLDQLDWQGKVAARSDSESGVRLRVDGNLGLAGVTVHHNPLERRALAFERLDFRAVALDWPGNQQLGDIELSQLILLERGADDFAPQLTSLGNLKVEGLKVTDLNLLEIDRIELRDHRLLYRLQPDGSAELDAWLPAADSPAEPDTAPAEAGKTFAWAIGELHYHGDTSIDFRDDRSEPAFVAALGQIEVTVADLDSRQPEQDSRLQLAATYGEHGALTLEGSLRPLAPKPSFDLNGKIDGLDLRQLTAFTRASIGHRIKSGQLDAELRLRAEQAVLDSEVSLTLNRFDIEALSDEDQEKVDSSLGLPLGPSLSLLRDRDERIRLSIPIEGDLENPDFDPGDVINKALSKAMTAAVINYYTPFGLVTVAEGIYDFATALEFDPVEFAPAQADLSGADPLESIATMMQERPGVDLTLCALSNDADRQALFPETAEIAAADLQLDTAQAGQLAALGETRAANVKRALVDRGIEAGRLVLCEPEHDPEGERALVEISI